ncbi:MAG: hypothetical protein SF052_20720 [Bacteroidia bacterium]|nr:hypothetical protein [Bacteroidia bacterium]
MNIEQQEQHILSLAYKLPILRRIRLALTILQGVEPGQIPVDVSHSEVEVNESELAQRILNRKQAYLDGKGKNISRQELMSKIYQELTNES